MATDMIPSLPYQDKPSRWSSHTRIARRLNTLSAHTKVLDVGTATGMLARMCQNNSLDFFGVEPNADWARIASPFYQKIWVQQIDTLSEETLRGYNAVVLGDVLEHLPAPEIVLQRLVKYHPFRFRNYPIRNSVINKFFKFYIHINSLFVSD